MMLPRGQAGANCTTLASYGRHDLPIPLSLLWFHYSRRITHLNCPKLSERLWRSRRGHPSRATIWATNGLWKAASPAPIRSQQRSTWTTMPLEDARCWGCQRAQTSSYLIQPCMACPAFRLLFRCRQNHLHSNCWGLTCCASILSTAIPVPIAASRKLALSIVSSMRLAPNSATLLRIPTILFFRALISSDSRRSTARTVSLVT